MSRRYAARRRRDRPPRNSPVLDFEGANAALAARDGATSIDVTEVLRRVAAGETWSEALRKERGARDLRSSV